MSYEQNIGNIEKAQKGDSQALTTLIEENNGLIWSIVRRFKDRGYEIEDLYQIGCIGFIKSIKRFDTSYDVKLSTYSVPYILGEIKRFIRDDGSIKVSRSLRDLARKIKDLQARYLAENGREITISKIAEELKISKEEVAVALEAVSPVISIYESSYSDEEGELDLASKLSTGVDETEKLTNHMSIQKILQELKDRDREIILLRYYRNKTQMEVSRILGISQVQVSRIEKKIFKEMKFKLAM